MRPHCAFCCQHKGWIVYGWEHTGVNTPHVPGTPVDCPGCYEVYAPCPFCEDGRAVEITAYGDNGYWSGDQPTPSQVQESCRCYDTKLSVVANQQRLDELKAKLKAHLGDTDNRLRQRVRERLSEQAITSVISEPAMPVKPDTMPSTNGQVDDDEIGVL